MIQLSDYHYDLPDELIAQAPLPNRSDSRLLVVNGQQRQHLAMSQLPDCLHPGDRLVFNNTRVIPARLFGQKESGGKLEMMLERITPEGHVLAKIRASKSPKPGTAIVLSGQGGQHCRATVLGRQDDLFRLVGSCEGTRGSSLESEQEAEHSGGLSLVEFIERHGEMPLPPYIQRKPDAADAERYQTVFAQCPGAVAAPTAGLHFDKPLLTELEQRGIDHSFITLHVGAGTFQPVRVDDVSKHVMHAERVEVSEPAVEQIRQTQASGGRIIAVGTTCVRSLEAAASNSGQLAAFEGETQLFITPGFQFNVVDAMVTNFHLPESTLLMLVAAFSGLENVRTAYAEAVQKRYRFFSYGDAMLLFPA